MAEKRRRSCQDAPAVPPSDNGSEDTSIDAVIPSGAGPGRGACSFMPRFLLHHIIFDHGLVDGFGPDQPRLQGNLLCRKDWNQLRESARSEWVIPPVQEVAACPGARSANTSAPEPASRRAGPSGLTLAGRRGTGAQARSMAFVQDVQTASAIQNQNMGVGPRQGWGLLPECARTCAFATAHRAIPARAPFPSAPVSAMAVLPGCHLTRCDSSFGH